MDSTASQVFAQIGFPPRRSVVSELFDKGVSFCNSVTAFEVNVATRARLVYALRLLFEAAESLYFERVREGIAQEDAEAVVLFDEVQDLIKDDRLAQAGGRYVFEYLGTLLVSYCVDRRVVRSVVAGSSAMLSSASSPRSALRTWKPASRSAYSTMVRIDLSSSTIRTV